MFDLFRLANMRYKPNWNPFAEFKPAETLNTAPNIIEDRNLFVTSNEVFSLSLSFDDDRDAMSHPSHSLPVRSQSAPDFSLSFDEDTGSEHGGDDLSSEDEDSKQFCADLVNPNFSRLRLADIDDTPLDKRERFPDSLEEMMQREGVG